MTAWASALADRLDPPPAPYQHDPAGWIRARLGEHTWSMQDRICHAIAHHPKVAVPASHGVGKSFLAGRIAAWWIDQHPANTAFAATTAPTFPQVSAILWKEINRAASRAEAQGDPLPGRILQTEWKIGRELVAYGRKPADTDEHGFQGIHAEHVLAVVDEACGIADNVWEGVESITTSTSSRILAIGNPTDPSARFARMCRPGSGWHILHIDALATPNITTASLTAAAAEVGLTPAETAALLAELPDGWEGENVPDVVARSLTSAWWIADKVRVWGIGSQLWQGKVRGQFPEAGDDTLIPLSWVEKAQQRDLTSDEQPELAVDVARFGSDETVVYERRGPILRPVDRWHGQDTIQTAIKVAQYARERRARYIRVDGVGVGGGVVDWLATEGYPVVDMQAGSSPRDPERFVNARAEWYWALRERFEDPAGAIDIHDDDELAGQLSAIKFSYDARGRVRIESKDEMKKRGMPSPDRADTVMMAFAALPDPEDVQDEVYEDLVEISPY